ncbi:hypothetical protein K3495_g13494 [Podosphaera aphanis]|nr:hypothetical protein K3495_g13494 [Podosphaera aphanis]
MKVKTRPTLSSEGSSTSVGGGKKKRPSRNFSSDISNREQTVQTETSNGSVSRKKKRRRHKVTDTSPQPKKKRKLGDTASSIDPTASSLKNSNPSSPSIDSDVKPRPQNELEGRQCMPNESRTSSRRPSKSGSTVESSPLPNAKSSNLTPASVRNGVHLGQHHDKNTVDFDAEAETESYETAPETGEESEFPTLTALSKLKSSKEVNSRHLNVGNEKTTEQGPTNPERPQAPLTASTTTSCGRISNEDIKIITNVIASYREQKNIPQNELNQIIQKDANKSQDSRELWSFVHDHIPTIPKQKLINICRRKFHNFEARGAWTPSQDEELSAVHEMYPGKWKKIGEILNRFPQDCRDRWRNYLVCGEKMRKDTWELKEEKMLRRAVNEFLDNYHKKYGVTDVDDNSLIDWQTISKMMGHSRSRLQCSMKWRSIKDRYESDGEHPNETTPLSRTPWRLEGAEEKVRGLTPEEKLRLLHAIREYDVKRESKIPWLQFQKQNTGVVGSKLELRVIFNNLKQSVPNHETMKLKDIVQYLIDTIESSILIESDKKSQLASKKARKEKSSSKRSKRKTSNATVSPARASSPQPISLTPSKKAEKAEVTRQDTNVSHTSQSKTQKNHQDPAETQPKSTRKHDGSQKSSKAEKRKSKDGKESNVIAKAPLAKAKRDRKSKKAVTALSEEKVVDSGDDL